MMILEIKDDFVESEALFGFEDINEMCGDLWVQNLL